jgi:hypothetical protein
MRNVRGLLVVLLALVMSFTHSSALKRCALEANSSQDPCPDIPGGGNLATLDEFAVAEDQCTVPQIVGPNLVDVPATSDLKPGGAFMKDAKFILSDAHAMSSGTCQVVYWTLKVASMDRSRFDMWIRS